MPPKPQSSKATPRRKPAAQTNRQRSGLTDYVFFLSPFLRVIPLIAVAATASYVSQLSLAPVYGDIPSALYHDRIVVGIFVSAWLLRLSIWSLGISTARPTAIIPVLVLYTPAILHHVFRYSARFGAVNGPVITEAVTFYPVLFLSVYAATGTKRQHGLFSITYAAVISFVFYHLVSVYLVKRYLPSHIGSSWVLTRCGLTHAVGGAYAALSPSLLLLAAIPALYHSATTNPMCVFTPALNATLAPWNHTIIARQESITGYVSVVENFDAGYRVLRCDHSLLGGEWLRPPAGFEHLGGFKEPIYAVFVIMEAVRLVEPAPQNPDPKALAM